MDLALHVDENSLKMRFDVEILNKQNFSQFSMIFLEKYEVEKQ